jgi:hypothetical protein
MWHGQFCGGQETNGDAVLAFGKYISSRDLSDVVAINRAGAGQVGEGQQQPQAFAVDGVIGREGEALAAGVIGKNDALEIVRAGFKWPDQYEARQLAARAAAALTTRRGCRRWSRRDRCDCSHRILGWPPPEEECPDRVIHFCVLGSDGPSSRSLGSPGRLADSPLRLG